MRKQSNKARLAELAGIIAQAKKEAGEAQMRVGNAESERYELEREVKRGQKPTPAMMELLVAMGDGTLIKPNRFNFNSYYTEDRDGRTASLRASLYFGLRDREAIEEVNTGATVYCISAHGRAILAKYQVNSGSV